MLHFLNCPQQVYIGVFKVCIASFAGFVTNCTNSALPPLHMPGWGVINMPFHIGSFRSICLSVPLIRQKSEIFASFPPGGSLERTDCHNQSADRFRNDSYLNDIAPGERPLGVLRYGGLTPPQSAAADSSFPMRRLDCAKTPQTKVCGVLSIKTKRDVKLVELSLVLTGSFRLLLTLQAGADVMLALLNFSDNALLGTATLETTPSALQRFVFLDANFRHCFPSLRWHPAKSRMRSGPYRLDYYTLIHLCCQDNFFLFLTSSGVFFIEVGVNSDLRSLRNGLPHQCAHWFAMTKRKRPGS